MVWCDCLAEICINLEENDEEEKEPINIELTR